LIALLITRASKVLATNICSKKPFSFNVSVEDATMFFYLNNNWNKSFYILFYFSNYVNLVDFHSLKHPTQTKASKSFKCSIPSESLVCFWCWTEAFYLSSSLFVFTISIISCSFFIVLMNLIQVFWLFAFINESF
jgi:hypothetical protein